MTITNEYERDLNDTSFLGRPGRVDMRVFQNTPDAGDGYPGLQRAFRNYLHEGGIEKDIQLLGFSILGDSVDINNAELQQLGNIGTATISGTQWGYVGEADQPVKQADSPTFVGLTLSANLVTTSTIDSVNISTFKTDYDTHKASTGIDHTYINQSVVTTTSPTFIGLTLSANLITTSTIDGVDVSTHAHSGAGQGGTVSYANLSNRGHILSGGDHTASGLTIGHVIRASGATTFAWTQLGHGDLSAIGSNAHSVIDTHLGSTSNPHTVTLDQAFDGGKIINGATSEANAFQVGEASDKIKFWNDGSHGYLKNTDGNFIIDSTSEISASVYLRTGGTGGTVKFQAGAIDRWTFNNFDYTLKVHANNSYDLGEDTVAFANIYSYEFVDKSKFPDKKVLAELMKIKSDKGKVDHSTLPDDLRIGSGRSLGANISYNTKAIQELLELINKLEIEIEVLKNK